MPGETQVLQRLEEVIDPCSLSMGGRRDIRSLGLVDGVRIEGSTVHVDLVLTDPSCVFWKGIRQNVIDAVSALPDVDAVEVQVSRTGVWSPARMRPAEEDATTRGVSDVN